MHNAVACLAARSYRPCASHCIACVTQALTDALMSGHLGGAGLDVHWVVSICHSQLHHVIVSLHYKNSEQTACDMQCTLPVSGKPCEVEGLRQQWRAARTYAVHTSESVHHLRH